MYVYLLLLIHKFVVGRNLHNIVKQLSANAGGGRILETKINKKIRAEIIQNIGLEK